MSIFGIKQVECPKNQWTTISNRSRGPIPSCLPAEVEVTYDSKL